MVTKNMSIRVQYGCLGFGFPRECAHLLLVRSVNGELMDMEADHWEEGVVFCALNICNIQPS